MSSNASPLLKDLLGHQALSTIADAGVLASPRFDRSAFMSAAEQGLEALSIMERVRHIADALDGALPMAYPDALEIVRAMAPHVTRGFQAVALAEFVGRHGLEAFEDSMAALADLTRFGSAEFAIRPFLATNHERTLPVMLDWAESSDEHVRRLASEGCRPRLPWAARVPALKSDPTLGAAILEALKSDPSAYVRKSVANHLNDVAKDDPDWVLDRLAAWPADDPRTAWIIRHALRTLIKQGNQLALALVGVAGEAAIKVDSFSVAPRTVRLGDAITIAVELVSKSAAAQRLVIDYRLNYARSSGKTAGKVFKMRTVELPAGATVSLSIKQTIKDFSTRRHYSGTHGLELIVNGQTVARTAFDLQAG